MRSSLRWNRLTNDHRTIGEIVLEAGAGQHRAQSLDRGVELALDGIGLGQGARIGFVLAGAMAAQLELVEQMRGGRGGVEFGIVVVVAEGEWCRYGTWKTSLVSVEGWSSTVMPGRTGSRTPPGAAQAGRGGADFVGR